MLARAAHWRGVTLVAGDRDRRAPITAGE